MDVNEAATPFVEEAGQQFAKVTVRDRSAVLRKLKAAARAELLKDLADSKIADNATIFAELDRHSRTPLLTGDFIAYANTPEGQEDILLAALRKANPGEGKAEEILEGLALTSSATMSLVAKLCGLEVQSAPAAKEGEGEGEPNPTASGEPQPLRGYGT